MIEAYAIGVTLSLKGNITSEIGAVARQFETLNRVIASSQMAVNELAAGMRGLSRLARGAADAWRDVASSMERAARASSRAGGAMSGGASGGGGGGGYAPSGSQSRALVPYAGGFAAIPGPIGGGSSPNAQIGSRALVPYNAGGTFYQSTGVANTNSGTFGGGPGTGSAGTSIMGVQGGFGGSGGMPPLSVPPWAAGLPNPRPGAHDFALATVGLGAAGHAMEGGAMDALRAEAAVREELVSLRMNTKATDADIAEARKIAEKVTRDVQGSQLAENIHHIADLFTVMGDLHEAFAGAPAFSEAAYLFQHLPGAHHGDSSFAAAQAIEVMQRHVGKDGKINMESFNQQMAAMAQVVGGTRGRIDGSSYLGFAKQSRVGGMVANDQYLYRDLPAMLIALGGNRAGTGDSAVWNQFVTGKMTANAFDALQEAGIIDDGANWNHGQVRDMEKHLVDASGFGANRVQWLRDNFFGPRGVFARNHIDPHNKLQVSQFLSKWSSRQTGLGFMSEAVLGMDNINKEGEKVDTTTKNPMAVMRQYSPEQGVREFNAAMNSLMVALGKEALGPALEALKSLTNAINAFSDFADKHPKLAKYGTEAMAGLGALALGLSALSGAFLLAPAMWRVATWLVLSTGLGQTAVAAAQLGAGTAAGAALAGIPRLLGGLAGAIIGFAAKVGAVHMGVTAVDPNDRLGSWIDKHIPGAGAVDDWFGRHTPFGRTYDDQHKAAPDLYQPQSFHPPANGNAKPITLIHYTVLDSKVVAKSVSSLMARDGSGPSGGATGFDGRAGYVGGMQMGAA